MPEAREPARPIARYEDLVVFRKSYDLALTVHRLSLGFPEFERHEIGRQIREASKSVPVNIAEGYGRRSSAADFKRFLVIAHASCDETKVWLCFAKDLGYLAQDAWAALEAEYEEVGKMLHGLTKNWRARGG